jgi:hypothetical protein
MTKCKFHNSGVCMSMFFNGLCNGETPSKGCPYKKVMLDVWDIVTEVRD